MKLTSLLIFCFLTAKLGAATLTVPQLAEPLFADNEGSATEPLPGPASAGDDFRIFRLTLSFAASPSNCVQVALGCDNLPSDGLLAAEETSVILGYDCGEWFLRPAGLRERFTVPATPGLTKRNLSLSIRFDSVGVPLALACEADNVPISFTRLSLPPLPAWLNPEAWDTLRVTTRGDATPSGALRAIFAKDGAVITIK